MNKMKLCKAALLWVTHSRRRSTIKWDIKQEWCILLWKPISLPLYILYTVYMHVYVFRPAVDSLQVHSRCFSHSSSVSRLLRRLSETFSVSTTWTSSVSATVLLTRVYLGQATAHILSAHVGRSLITSSRPDPSICLHRMRAARGSGYDTSLSHQPWSLLQRVNQVEGASMPL